MSLADETLIRDPDLVAQLEAQRGKLAFDVTVRHLISQQERRNAEASLPREMRRRTKTREAMAVKKPELPDLRATSIACWPFADCHTVARRWKPASSSAAKAK